VEQQTNKDHKVIDKKQYKQNKYQNNNQHAAKSQAQKREKNKRGEYVITTLNVIDNKEKAR
jgi:hypothetical protein